MTTARDALLERGKTIEAQQGEITQQSEKIAAQKEAFDSLTAAYVTTQATLRRTEEVLGTTKTTLAATEKERNHFKDIAFNRLPGALVHLTDAIVPARVTKESLRNALGEKRTGLSGSYRGVILVNCWIGADGIVKRVRMVQPLEGGGGVDDINEFYLDAAKRLVFHPATSADGKVAFQVWQGYAFYVNE